MGKGRMHRYEWGKDNDSGTAATRKSPYYKSVDQESSLFLTMDSQTSSPVGPAA